MFLKKKLKKEVTKNKRYYFKIKSIILFSLLTGAFLLPVFCSAKVVINEIAWMGTATSSNEWIELYNNSSPSTDIKEWSIYGADTKKCLNFSNADGNITTIIPEYGYLIYANGKNDIKDINGTSIVDIWDATIGMNNESPGQIILYNSLNCQGDKIDIIDQTNKWLKGSSKTKQTMERIGENWQTSQNPGGTPKQANSPGETKPTEPEQETTESGSQSVPVASNYPPYAEAGPDIVALTSQKLVFDGSKSRDPDRNNLTFFWNFGDGATDTLATTTHFYLYPGQYIATLTVSDGHFSDIDALTVNIFDNSVIISEFSPEQGWVELFNQSGQIANLSSWRLNDFVFPENSLIAPKQYLILTKDITRLESNGQISLTYPDGSTACQIEYKKDNPSIAMAFDGQDYFWTNLATPGSLNLIDLADLKQSYLTTNNPSVQTKPAEEKITLGQKDVFAAKVVETEKETENNRQEENKEENKYAASLSQAASQAATTGEKKKLILIISIIVSASFVLALGIIFLKRKIFN